MGKRIQKKMALTSVIALLMMFLMSASAFAAPKLAKKTLTLKTGNYYVLRLKGNSEGNDVTWKTSAKKIVGITSSSHNRVVLKAKKAGTAKITAKIGGKKLRCTITVKKNSKMPATLKLRIGDKFTFKVSKKAAWSLSNAKGTLTVASNKKSASYKARKTGKCVLTAKTKKKTYTCTIRMIRKSGATSADLKEEEAIKNAKQAAEAGGSDTGDSEGTGDNDNSDSGSVNTPVASTELTSNQKSLMSGLAYWAAVKKYDTEDLTPGEMHAMDLADSDQAFLLYYYQYHADDSRIKSAGEYNIATKNLMKTILAELFRGCVGSGAFDYFCSNYVEKEAGDNLYMSASGDFGDAGKSFFKPDDTVTYSDGMYTMTGQVMMYNSYMNTYIHTYSFKASFWRNDNGSLKFEYVEVI